MRRLITTGIVDGAHMLGHASTERSARAIGVAVICLLSACASLIPGQRFTPAAAPNSSEALVYFYRPSHMRSTLLEVKLYFDGKPIASLGLNDHTLVRTTPGRHVVGVAQPLDLGNGSYPQPYQFILKAEKTYLLTLETGPDEAARELTVHRWRLDEDPRLDDGIQNSSYRPAKI